MHITDHSEVQLKHFLDALTVTLVWPAKPNPRVIDIGTGAGIPGIPLKILRPEIMLVLLEATAKKTVFLKHIVDTLEVSGVEIMAGRAEDLAHDARYRERCDLALARAVASLPALVELTLPFCAIGGRFISQKKGNVDEEINQSLKATKLMGGRLLEVKKIEMTEFPDQRCLVVYEKVAPTPKEYPRRSGMPATKPIV